MARHQLTEKINEIRHLREETLTNLIEIQETDFDIPTDMNRWTEIRRVLLRFGDHMREHANQINGLRATLRRDLTMPQRILAESEIAWGVLLGSLKGLDDQDLDIKPSDGSWSLRQVLDHISKTERAYLQAIQEARQKKNNE
jgi:hypothetical protein